MKIPQFCRQNRGLTVFHSQALNLLLINPISIFSAAIQARRWNIVAGKFLQIPINKYFELNEFTIKLFEIATEETYEDNDEISISNDAFPKFLREIEAKRKQKLLLPLQQEILTQLAASFIMHLSEENPKAALDTLLECFKINVTPWTYFTYYNPEAESKAINNRFGPMDVLRECFHVLLNSHIK